MNIKEIIKEYREKSEELFLARHQYVKITNDYSFLDSENKKAIEEWNETFWLKKLTEQKSIHDLSMLKLAKLVEKETIEKIKKA